MKLRTLFSDTKSHATLARESIASHSSATAATVACYVRAMTAKPLTRVEIADIALALFAARGYDEVSAADIAQAAHISRSTFFRQFGTKDDVIFADHDDTLDAVHEFFNDRLEHRVESFDAHADVIDAAALVFERFSTRLASIRARDRIVRATPRLRDREIVTVTRYEKAFAGYLREQLPALRTIEAVQFAGVVATTHNAVLRQLIRGDEQEADAATLRIELERVRERFTQSTPPAEAGAVVAVFSAQAPFSTVAQHVRIACEGLREI